MPENELDIVVRLKDEASRNARSLTDSLGREFRTIRDVDLPYIRDSLNSFGKNAVRVGGILTAALTVPIVGIGKAAFDAASSFEQSQVAFTTMLGSADKARKLLNQLALFAAKTPFQLPEVEQGAKMLLAMGAGLDDVIGELRIMGDVSAGLNVPIERLILNFGQVRAQGKLTGRELRDFAIAGVPLLDELAKSMGRTKEEITSMVSRGEIGFDAVKQAFIAMTGEGGRFNDLMQRQSETTAGKISNLKDQFTLLMRELGVQLLPIANAAIAAISGIVEKFSGLSDEQKKTIILVAGALAAIGPAIAILGTIAIAVAALLTPVGLVVLAIAGIGIAIAGIAILVKLNFDKIKGFLVNLKSNWAYYLGQMIAFFVLLPINLPRYVSSAVSKIIGVIRSVNWKSIWSVVVSGLSSAIGAIPGIAKNLINGIIFGLNSSFARGVFPINKIRLPYLAHGVDNFGGGLAVVGERGPELVNLPRGSDVIPNNRIGSTGGVTQNFVFNQVSTAFDVELAMQRAALMARRGFR